MWNNITQVGTYKNTFTTQTFPIFRQLTSSWMCEEVRGKLQDLQLNIMLLGNIQYLKQKFHYVFENFMK